MMDPILNFGGFGGLAPHKKGGFGGAEPPHKSKKKVMYFICCRLGRLLVLVMKSRNMTNAVYVVT